MSNRMTLAIHAIALVFCMLTMPGVVLAQSIDYQDHREFPDGRKGERISALLDAVNQNDSSAVVRLMNDHVTEGFRTMAPNERHLSVFRSTHRQTGGLDFYSIRTYNPAREQTIVIVKDRIYGGWYSFILEFDDAEERLSNINFSPARSPADAGGAVLTEAEFIEQAQRAVARGCELDAFSGAVLIARGDDVLFETACGEASKRFGVPNNVDTKFNLGSMNKMFTATAIMQLVEAGEIALDDTVSRYVDESWLPKEITERITIRHLLTHTSGLGSYFNDAFWKGSRSLYRNLEDYKPLLENESLAFEPGSKFGYSNTGMLMLGVVIESVTGRSYFDYIRENIYEPAGMADSDSYSMDEPVPNLAIGYIPAPENAFGWRNNIFDHVIKGGPAGGGFSTVRDLHRFSQALLKGDLLSDESRERLWTPPSEGGHYGYGFGISYSPAGKVVGHSGGFPGLNGNLDVFPDSGYAIAVLANYDRAASPLADHIKGLLVRLQSM